MGKQKSKTLKQDKTNEIGFSFSKIIPEKFQTVFLLILLFILILIFFSPILFGDKTTTSGDLIQVKSLREFSLKERDGVSLWNPHIFCGMPAVVTSMSMRWYDFTVLIYSYTSRIYTAFFKEYNALYTFNFIILAFTTFFFMRSFGARRGISFLVATGTTFSTGILVLFYIGHVSKLISLTYLPFILMMLFKFQKEIKLLDVLLLIFAMHLLIFSAHVQIVFYFALSALIYFIYFFSRSFITKDKFLQKQLLKSLGIAAGAGIIALLMSFDTYSEIYEYKPYSTRGTKSITENTVNTSNQDSYEYNTNWSFSPGELLTFIVPSYYGFGKSKYQGPLTNNQQVEVNTYFGQMPFVDTAMYMGVIIFALGLFALFVRWKEPVVRFFGITVLFFILISFGKNFPLVFNLMYYYFPFFDNFRTPSMILHVVQLFFPILAGFGIMSIISLRENKNANLEKVLKNITIVFAVLFLLSLLLSGSISSWFSSRVNSYAATLGNSQEAQMFNALAEYMSDMFTGDLQIAMALLVLTFGLSYAYAASKINKELLITALAILIIFDLFRIGNRGASYVESERIKQMFNEPEYITVIKNQNEKEPYRILNLKQDGSMGSIQNNANFNVYFLQEDFFGYSAVKPRSFQDLMDVVGPANPTLWRMLGVKYLITDRPFELPGTTIIHQSQNTVVYRNNMALPRVYFVDSVSQKNPLELLTRIRDNSFDPKRIAYLENEEINYDYADSTAEAKIIEYKDEKIIVKTKNNGNNFLFVGTTYLPGWKAFIDGNEYKIHKTNHGFMGVVVPAGEHNVQFIYEPTGFIVGKYISLILNIMLLSSIAVVAVYKAKRKVQ